MLLVLLVLEKLAAPAPWGVLQTKNMICTLLWTVGSRSKYPNRHLGRQPSSIKKGASIAFEDK